MKQGKWLVSHYNGPQEKQLNYANGSKDEEDENSLRYTEKEKQVDWILIGCQRHAQDEPRISDIDSQVDSDAIYSGLECRSRSRYKQWYETFSVGYLEFEEPITYSKVYMTNRQLAIHN